MIPAPLAVYPERRRRPRISAPPRRSVSVVIPAYNEESRLPATVEEIHRFLTEKDYDAEIVVVDDGSRDRTRAVAEAMARRLPLLRVIGEPVNRGKGYAVRTGMLAARGGAVLFSDADQSTPIRCLERLWPWYDRGFDVVIGSRRSEDSATVQPLHRRLMGRTFGLLVAVLAVRGFRDTQCGFKLFRRDAARAIFGPLRTHGFAFDVEALMEARARGFRMREVGVEWVSSADTRVRAVRDAARMTLELLRLRRLL